MIRNQMLVGLFFLSSVAMAKDTIWLDNGDRIVGDIVLKSDDRLVVDTGYAGRIYIDWERVVTLETGKPITIHIEGVEAGAKAVLDISANGTVICKTCATPIIALKDVDTLVYPTLWISDFRTEGNIDLSARFERKDNDTDEYNLDSEVRVYHGKWRHILSGEKEKKSEDGVVNKNKWEGKYGIDRFFGEHLYLRTMLEYQKDHEGELFRARQYGAGPGYLFWDDKLSRFDISASYVKAELWSEDGFNIAFHALLLSWDYRRAVFGDRFTFYFKGDAVAPDIDEVDLIVSSELGLKYKINGWLSADISYNIDETKASIGDTRDYETKVGIGANW